jgi:hypothetical protein
MNKSIVTIGGQKVRKIAQSDGDKGHTYGRIMRDFARKGQIPISIEFYNKNSHVIPYSPFRSNCHGSYAPQDVSFEAANAQYSEEKKRYGDCHVSIDPETGKKVVVRLLRKTVLLADAEKPKSEWAEVGILQLVNHIISFELGKPGEKPNCEYEYDRKGKADVTTPVPEALMAAPFITKDGVYELKDGVWVKSNLSNPNANTVVRADGVNWNGLFALGSKFHGRYVLADLQPSVLSEVLIIVENALVGAAKLGLKEIAKAAGTDYNTLLVLLEKGDIDTARTLLKKGTIKELIDAMLRKQ